jgi:hypothetical protein
MEKKRSSRKSTKPQLNPELEGFDIKINSFGEINTSFDVSKINEFLNRNVEDKKLVNRDDLDEWKPQEDVEEDDSPF